MTNSTDAQPATVEDEPSDISGIASFLVTHHAVHLVVQVAGDWEAARDETVLETERLCIIADTFANSPAFATRFPNRVGVIRLMVQHAPPDVVKQVLFERGVDIELEGETRTGTIACAFCQRTAFSDQQVSMTDQGWACPSCFRAWVKKTESARIKPKRPLWKRLLGVLFYVSMMVFFGIFAYSVLHEFLTMHKASNNIRQHLPRE